MNLFYGILSQMFITQISCVVSMYQSFLSFLTHLYDMEG